MRQLINIKEKGQSLVELALFLPLILIIIGGLVEVGQFLVIKNRIDTAANLAARFGANGGQNAGMADVALNSITQTLTVSDQQWDIWAFRGKVNDIGTEIDPATFEYEHVYGLGNTTLYPEFVDNNAQLRVEIYNELVSTDEVDVNGDVKTDQQNIKDVEFAGTLVVYDAESILRLNTVLEDVYSVQALHVMRTFPSSDATNGCSAFPIVIQRGERSVTDVAGQNNTFPAANLFKYPADGLVYDDFPGNEPNIPLEEAQPGYMYLFKEGEQSGNFGWVRWNEYSNGNEGNLVDNLTWPGRSTDYSNSGAKGSAPPDPGYTVYGYIEPGDDDDRALHIGDWVPGATGAVNSNAVRNTLADHIEKGRVMRFLVYDPGTSTGNGVNARYLISGFVVLRLHGYRLQGNDSWILAEFISWDDSCGQVTNLPGTSN
ncbi:MAG: pilus assembly protein [Anaerolineales bacterium]|nr:pilus assembly protein [Anaerolineales bacterium]